MNLYEWTTDAAHDKARRGEYMDLPDAERTEARRYVRDYAQSPLTGVDASLRLCGLLMAMHDMERALEQGGTREQWENTCDHCGGIGEHDPCCAVAQADADSDHFNARVMR